MSAVEPSRAIAAPDAAGDRDRDRIRDAHRDAIRDREHDAQLIKMAENPFGPMRRRNGLGLLAAAASTR